MPSMLEVMREYKHLTAKKRAEGSLPPPLEERLAELEDVVKGTIKKSDAPDSQNDATPPPALTSQQGAKKAPGLPAAKAKMPAPTPRAQSAAAGASTPAAPAQGATVTPATARPPPATTTNPGRIAPNASQPGTKPSPIARANAAPQVDAAPRATAREAAADVALTPFEKLMRLMPEDPGKRVGLVAVAACIMLTMDLALAIAIGVPASSATSTLVFWLALIGLTGWALFYPLLILWRERAAATGGAHINEPDFEAKPPVVEPIIVALTVLAMVVWVWLGGHTTRGVPYLVGLLVSFSLGLAILGFSAVVAMRPAIRKRVKARALRQYLEGGTYHLNKNNPKRARRLLERALEEARGTPKANEVARHLKNATLQEADELRKRGHFQQADELIRQQSSRPGMELLVGWAASASGPGASATTGSDDAEDDIQLASQLVEALEGSTADDVLAAPPRAAVLISPGDIMIDSGASRKQGADEAAIRERAKILERRGRQRESFELFVQNRVPVTRQQAEAAAKDYISQGLLRSADAIYEALGQRQMPEFYQAVAAEWAKDTGGDPPAEACTRLARILDDLGQSEAAARVACRGALSKMGDQAAKKEATDLALELCKRLGMEPPVELVEAMGDFATAAREYEREGRTAEAFKCYQKAADQALQKKEPAAKLIPLLSKIFLLDEAHEIKYLEPLGQHVLDTNASGPSSMKILKELKKRKKDDERLAARLFQLYVDAMQGDDAYGELEVLAKSPSATPEGLIKEYRLFVERFPGHLKARAQYVRVLLKLSRIDDAAAQVRLYIGHARTAGADPAETIELIELLLDWGHDDKELRKSVGVLRIEKGEREKGLADLERYAREGGRDPEVLEIAKSLLGEDLALPNGAPNHARLLNLGRFLLYCGDPEAGIPHLEICRASKEQKGEAEILLARAYTAVQQPKRSVALIQKAVAGRPLGETLELHYELARSLEALGAYGDAEKIDRAIKKVNPEFAAEYEKLRPRADRADTAWAPGSEGAGADADQTDVSAKAPPPSPSQAKKVAPRSASDTGSRAKNPGAKSDSPPPRSTSQPSVPASAKIVPTASQPGSGSGARSASQAAQPGRTPTGRSSSRSQPGVLGPLSPVSPAGAISPSRQMETDDGAAANLGETLLPRYRLLRKLGAGGMGEVHLAEDVDLGRYVAIKVLRRTLATDLFLAKFKEEARIVAQLQHPNIVSIFDLGQKGYYSYIVMEYVDGPDLASLVNKSGGFHRHRLIKIVATVADAMDYAHSRGVIHRDLKPANILVGPNDLSKVTDFGIAKVLAPEGPETAFSAAGLQVGTVNYMAPEQIGGKAIDARTDLYLLATTVYVCLTGSFPYTGDAIVFQKLREDATPLRAHVNNISTELEGCVMKCLARRPDDRYQSMGEFAEAIRRVPEARPR